MNATKAMLLFFFSLTLLSTAVAEIQQLEMRVEGMT